MPSNRAILWLGGVGGQSDRRRLTLPVAADNASQQQNREPGKPVTKPMIQPLVPRLVPHAMPPYETHISHTGHTCGTSRVTPKMNPQTRRGGLRAATRRTNGRRYDSHEGEGATNREKTEQCRRTKPCWTGVTWRRRRRRPHIHTRTRRHTQTHPITNANLLPSG